MQLLHSVNCKTNNSIFEKNLFDNKTFNLCFLLTLGINLLVACVPFMYKLFNLEFLNLSQWVVVIIASILIIPSCELIKTLNKPTFLAGGLNPNNVKTAIMQANPYGVDVNSGCKVNGKKDAGKVLAFVKNAKDI